MSTKLSSQSRFRLKPFLRWMAWTWAGCTVPCWSFTTFLGFPSDPSGRSWSCFRKHAAISRTFCRSVSLRPHFWPHLHLCFQTVMWGWSTPRRRSSVTWPSAPRTLPSRKSTICTEASVCTRSFTRWPAGLCSPWFPPSRSSRRTLETQSHPLTRCGDTLPTTSTWRDFLRRTWRRCVVKQHTKEFVDWLDNVHLKDRERLGARDQSDEILAANYDDVIKQFNEFRKNKNTVSSLFFLIWFKHYFMFVFLIGA